MTINRPVSSAIAAFAMMGILLSVASASQAAAYTYTVLSHPNASAAVGTYAIGINNSGQVVGYFYDKDAFYNRGFLYNGSTYSTIDVPNATDTLVFGINNNGQVVGQFYDNMGSHAFVYDGHAYTTLNIPNVLAFGINDGRQVVGVSGLSGFVYDGSSYTILDNPNATSTGIGTVAYGINNSGQIAGAFQDATSNHGFVYDGSGYTTLDVPNATATSITGINNSGQVVGQFYDNMGSHAFVYDGHAYTTLDIPDAVGLGINDAGQVTGYFVGAMGLSGFVASPVPLPAPLWLFGLAMPSLAWFSRRKPARPE